MAAASNYSIRSELVQELAAFRTAGSALNENAFLLDGDASKLPTVCAFIDENREIQKLFDLYMQLVQKDAAEFESLYQQICASDRSQAGRLK